jgi:carboxymethylenebutenolidase
VKPDEVALDVQAAMARLAEVSPGAVFTVGFCFGGGQSWRLAASNFGLVGTIGFYGQPKPVTEVLDQVRLPLLLLIAGDDVATPQEDFRALEDGLSRVGADYELTTYEGAPHSFFDRSYGDWREACEDSWRRIINFTKRHGQVR